MKLYFAKVYDTMTWNFMIQTMTSIRIHSNFIDMTKFLFQEASIVAKY